MIYKPATGSMWDPSVLWHEGKYHAFMMYNKDGPNGLDAQHCLLAVSEGGVHWRDEAVVNEEREIDRGSKFFKCFVGRCGDRFIMDHGVQRPEGQDTLRFYESADLREWTYIDSTQPDERWYIRPGRWDHMYILPKEEGNPGAGYWGHVVSVPKPEVGPGAGMMQSPDGRTWEVVPPAAFEFGDVPVRDHFEYGGCERIGGKCVLIGGTDGYAGHDGYAMFTLIADEPTGPFRADAEAFRLCGASSNEDNMGAGGWLAAWCRGRGGELLISNYASHPDSGICMLPMRKPVFTDGHLRLGWWAENEALKGRELAQDAAELTADGWGVAELKERFDRDRGIIIEGRVRARPRGERAAVGFAFERSGPADRAILLGVGDPTMRETHVGELTPTDSGDCDFRSMDVAGRGCATVTGLDPDTEHAFRLLARLDFFELYVDDLLVQTYQTCGPTGRITFIAREADASATGLTAWEMSL